MFKSLVVPTRPAASVRPSGPFCRKPELLFCSNRSFQTFLVQASFTDMFGWVDGDGGGLD